MNLIPNDLISINGLMHYVKGVTEESAILQVVGATTIIELVYRGKLYAEGNSIIQQPPKHSPRCKQVPGWYDPICPACRELEAKQREEK